MSVSYYYCCFVICFKITFRFFIEITIHDTCRAQKWTECVKWCWDVGDREELMLMLSFGWYLDLLHHLI